MITLNYFIDSCDICFIQEHRVFFCFLGTYMTQSMRVHWNSFLSEPFCVSNGVRQGRSVLPPFLFAVYLDVLLVELSKSGVGCHWGGSFAGAFGYADDVVLLSLCITSKNHVNYLQLFCCVP